jgi:hypothetical protein
MNEIIQVKTRVCDTYCSHHHFSSLITLALKVNIYCTRLKFIVKYHRSFLYKIELIIR